MSNSLNQISTVFDAVSQFLDSTEIDDKDIEKMEQFSNALNEMGPVFIQMQDNMFEENADEEEWNAYSSTLEKYSSVMTALEGKMDTSDSFIDAENESFSKSTDKSFDEEVDRFNYVSDHLDESQEEANKLEEVTKLLLELNQRQSGFEGVEYEAENSNEEIDSDELIDALKYVDFVSSHFNKVEGEVKSKFGEGNEFLGERLNEKNSSFEQEKEASIMSKLGFSKETFEDYLRRRKSKTKKRPTKKRPVRKPIRKPMKKLTRKPTRNPTPSPTTPSPTTPSPTTPSPTTA
jgi:hypothetical protein